MSQFDDSENNDPYNGDGGGPQAPAPNTPQGDPWTAAELAESQNFANQYYTSHGIPGTYGTANDLGNAYLYQRRQGLNHQDALTQAPVVLGWDKYSAPVAQKPVDAPTAPPPPDNGGGGGSAPPPPAGAPPPSSGGQVPIAPPTLTPGGSPMDSQATDLFNYLMGKAHQSELIDPNDPMIRKQADTFSANQTREGRRYLSELAERKGAGGNIGAESRMVAEKNAQSSATHEAELVQHEADQRKAEIQNALQTGAQFLTEQQKLSLQRELATIDNNMKLYQTQIQDRQFGRNLDQQESQFGRSLAEQQAGRAQSGGIAGASESEREREFNENLRQRAYEYDTDDEYRRSAYAAK